MSRAARRLPLGAVVVVAAVVGASSCTAIVRDGDDAASQVRKHATVAGTVMTRDAYPLRAIDAAALVAGHTDKTTIQVLRADGTTRGGHVVLRIDVERADETTNRVRYCFDYHFGRSIGSGAKPRQLQTCPPGQPLPLPSSPPPGVGPVERATALTALKHLSKTERVEASAVRYALTAQLGPQVFVGAATQGAGVVVKISSGDQCMTARTTPTTVTVGPLSDGTDCRGG